jgi:hypothetical protein
MNQLFSRRHFIVATAASAAAPNFVHAQISGQGTYDGQTFIGTRSADGTSGSGGGTAIVGQSNMFVRNCQFQDFGDGAILFDKTAENIRIEDCTVSNCYRFLKDWSAQHPDVPAPISQFSLKRIRADKLKRNFMRILYNSKGGRVEDVIAYCHERGASYCVGFAVDDTVSDITYVRSQAHNFVEFGKSADHYWQGDAFSDERGCRQIRYYACVGTGCGDAGFDSKSGGVYMQNCLARDNKRNYRLWNTGTLKNCRSEEPFKRGGTGEAAHFAFAGSRDANTGPVYVLDSPVVRAAEGNTAPVFLFMTDKPASIAIYNADIDAPSATLIRVIGPEPSIHWYPALSEQKIRVARKR